MALISAFPYTPDYRTHHHKLSTTRYFGTIERTNLYKQLVKKINSGNLHEFMSSIGDHEGRIPEDKKKLEEIVLLVF